MIPDPLIICRPIALAVVATLRLALVFSLTAVVLACAVASAALLTISQLAARLSSWAAPKEP